MHSVIRFVLAASAATLLTTPAFAQDSAAPANLDAATSSDSITIGAGGIYLPDYEGSDDYRFTPAPGAIGSIKGFHFELAGNRASIDLIPDQTGPGLDFQFGPIAVVDLNRTSIEDIQDPRIKALGKLGTAVELGAYAGIGKRGIITSPYDKLSVSVSYRHDVSGVHASGIWQPSIAYQTPLSTAAAFGLFASAEHAGRGYADSYFSITPQQSLASGLPVYDARAGWKNYTLGALATVALTGDLLHGFKLVAGGTYKRLLNDFADSPVVAIAGSRNQWLGAAGLAYTF